MDQTQIASFTLPRSAPQGYAIGAASPAMRLIERTIADLAPTNIPVLLVGESGTGKEIVALELHRLSRRGHLAFVKCRCGTLTQQTLRACLQGGTDGTDGSQCGTLLLDEPTQLDAESWASLLHLLPDGQAAAFEPECGARLISATSRNIEDEVHAGHFPRELYYRLNGVTLRLPPLRSRKEDIAGLMDFFLKKYSALFDKSTPELDPGAWDILSRHSWPGNVRELENVARKIVALGDGQLALADLEAGLNAVEPAKAPTAFGRTSGLRPLKEASREASRHAERELIARALDRTHWNRKRTARELQISYKALLYKLKQLGLSDQESD
ncbi:MAG: sigma 54-interacting transcriptional regulator [Candidatus Acidiferrales bacterium]|jgi:two-component system response regulator AtoC